MTFKVKRWGPLGTIDVRDFDPAAEDAPPESGASSWVYSFGGRLVFMCYCDGDPVYYTYDPAGQAWTGPHTGATAPWSWYNSSHGFNAWFSVWGNQYLMVYGQTEGYYFAGKRFWGIGPDFTFTDWSADLDTHFPIGASSSASIGTDGAYGTYGGGPARLAHLYATVSGVYWSAVAIYGPGGTTVIEVPTGQHLYNANTGGSARHESQVWGDYFTWYNDECGISGDYGLYGLPPQDSNKCATVLGALRPYGGVHPEPFDGNVYFYLTSPTTTYATTDADPLTAVTLPYASVWELWREQDGLGYGLDEHDLDGREHGATVPPHDCRPSFNAGLGWYIANHSLEGLSTQAYALDPFQPGGWTLAGRGIRDMAWMGTANVRDALSVDADLSLEGGAVDCYGRVAQTDIARQIVYTPNELHRGGAYWRDVVVRFDGYPTTDPDWRFPGTWLDTTRRVGFWDMFVRTKALTVVGFAPDPNYGLLNPTLANCSQGLAVLDENLNAPDWTHTISESCRVANTGWATASHAGIHHQLVGVPWSDHVIYLDQWVTVQTQPTYVAKVGRITGGKGSWSWETVLDFDGETLMPDLGQDGGSHLGWTVQSVTGIPPCLGLRRGGWLVGATLYFRPWGEVWAWDAGTRDATFLDTGNGWVPSLPSYDGPVVTENAPSLWSDLDEWTVGRSVYGSDALLVYDIDGTFITHLNADDVYPANGRALLVTQDEPPRVIYQAYRWSQYSDSAEYWAGGRYVRGDDSIGGDSDLSAPMWVCYDLYSGTTVQPGMGTFRGFCYPDGIQGVRQEAGPDWRWDSSGYGYDYTYPRLLWPHPGSVEMALGSAGFGLTQLGGSLGAARRGVRGVGRRG